MKTPGPKRKYTEQQLEREALKYSYKKDFRAGSPAMFAAAQRYGLLPSIGKHFRLSGTNKGARKYSEEELQQVAFKYSTRGEFNTRDYTSYAAARRYGILDDVCGHMSPAEQGPGFGHRYLYIIRDSSKVYVGITKDPKSRFEGHRVIKKFDSDYCIRVSKCPFPEKVAVRQERRAIAWLRKNSSLQVLNVRDGGQLGTGRPKYTTSGLARVVASCSSWAEFRINYPREYSAVKHRGLKQKMASLLGESIREVTFHTEAQIQGVVNGCLTKSQFRKEFPNHYAAAKYRKLLQKVDSWLDNGRGCIKARQRKEDLVRFVDQAKHCTTWSEFCKRYPKDYVKIKNRNLLSEIKSHVQAPIAA